MRKDKTLKNMTNSKYYHRIVVNVDVSVILSRPLKKKAKRDKRKTVPSCFREQAR